MVQVQAKIDHQRTDEMCNGDDLVHDGPQRLMVGEETRSRR